MRILLATDADWLAAEVIAAVGGPDVAFTVCAEGRDIARVVGERDTDAPFDLGVLDLQIGSMGGMAVTMALRLDESAGRLPHVPVLMLLDRVADVHLARRSGAEGWMVKPLDPLRLGRAVRAITGGGRWVEGVPEVPEVPVTHEATTAEAGPDGPTPEEEPATTG